MTAIFFMWAVTMVSLYGDVKPGHPFFIFVAIAAALLSAIYFDYHLLSKP